MHKHSFENHPPLCVSCPRYDEQGIWHFCSRQEDPDCADRSGAALES